MDWNRLSMDGGLRIHHHRSSSNFPLHFAPLEVLDLSSNDFNGAFPNSINLPALQELDFSGNGFYGSIPAGIFVNSTRLHVLKLAVNSLNGCFIKPAFRESTGLLP